MGNDSLASQVEHLMKDRDCRASKNQYPIIVALKELIVRQKRVSLSVHGQQSHGAGLLKQRRVLVLANIS